jgi:hypothetical protein
VYRDARSCNVDGDRIDLEREDGVHLGDARSVTIRGSLKRSMGDVSSRGRGGGGESGPLTLIERDYGEGIFDRDSGEGRPMPRCLGQHEYEEIYDV